MYYVYCAALLRQIGSVLNDNLYIFDKTLINNCLLHLVSLTCPRLHQNELEIDLCVV